MMFTSVLYVIAKILTTKVSDNRVLVKYIIAYHIMKYYAIMKNHVFKEHLIVRENEIYYVGEKSVKKLVGTIKSHFNKIQI